MRLLPYSTRYDVLVCYANVTLSTLPAPKDTIALCLNAASVELASGLVMHVSV